MSIVLETISFNHNLTSADTDAFNIRRNESTPVDLPEWRRCTSVKPEDSPAAYAVGIIDENNLTICAEFSRPDCDHQKALVRATPASITGAAPTYCLGKVAATEIAFDANQKTTAATLKLAEVRIKGLGVGVCNIAWLWQYSVDWGASWIYLTTTAHRIYRVILPPSSPWEQSPFDRQNIHLPWTEVLDYACVWGATSGDVERAAESVTRSVYSLGITRVLEYDGGASYAASRFDCTAFLQRLRGQFGNGAKVNCTDCATIVSTFANILGCELSQAEMGPHTLPPLPPRGRITLLPHLRIGSNRWEGGRFTFHEVAWEGNATKDDEVHDACLVVDGDDVPGVGPPQIHLLPSNLRFGSPNDTTYRFRLAPPVPATGEDPCLAHPHTRKRRKIGPMRADGIVMSEEEFKHLERLYGFDLGPERRTAPGTKFVEDFDLSRQKLPRLELLRFQAADAGALPWWIESFWEVGGRGAPGLLKIEAFVTTSKTEASRVILKLRTEFETELDTVREHGVGDLALTDASDLTLLFMRDKFAFAIRNVGNSSFPVIWVGREIDKLLTSA